MTKRILGIDPGLSGGWALVDDNGAFIDCCGFPTHIIRKNGRASTQIDGRTLAVRLAQTKADFAFVEAVSSRPRQAGQFQFGVNCGLIHGILHAHQFAFQLVAPVSWKSAFGIHRAEGETKREKKTEARNIVSRLYPQHADRFCRVKDDGVAEATLIALYGLSLLFLN